MPIFGRDERIRKGHEFKRIYQNGKKVVKKHFVVYAVIREDDTSTTRLGISVSKRVDKKACVRNRIKRLLRESFRLNKDKCKKGYDVIIVARHGILELGFHEMGKLLVNIINEICTHC